MEYNAATKGGVWDDVKKGRSRGHRAEEDEELLIFGYSCKLFRDDEKALYIDKEMHLIPWMGNPELMIDRFDVRGALYDLREAEAKGKPFEETATEAELKEEEICEEERYLTLYHNENLLQIYKEEEAKRLQSELISDGNSYYQVGFDYSSPFVENALVPLSHSSQIKDELPPLPLNKNDHSSSVQQEPVSYNPSADDDIFMPPPELNIPQGMEVPTTVKQNKVIVKTAKFVVSQGGQMEIVIKTKQAGNPMFNFLAFDNGLNAYYKHLVHTIRNGRYKFDVEPTPKSEQNDQYLHPNLSQSVKPDLTPGALSSPSRPSPHCAYSKLITKIREKQIASALEDPEFHSPIAPLSPVTVVNAPIDIEVRQIQNSMATPKTNQPVVGLVDYPSFNQTADGSSDMEESEPTISKRESFKKTVSRLQIHDYSHIKWPPPDIQMVIDKMASYIIKNGSVFEDVVRSRSDQRFMFLKKDHEYHPYYQCKMQLYKEVYGDIFKNSSKGGKIQEWKKKMSGTSSKKDNHNHSEKGRTISFAIKSREQEVSVTSHTTFPIESSTSEDDDEMEEDEREQRRFEREKRRQERKLKANKEKKEREEFLRKERIKKEEERNRERMEDSSSGNEDLYDIFKYAQEMEQEKNKRSLTPETSIPPSKQEERKKKAAVFLSKLKDTKDEKKLKSRPVFGPQLPPELSSVLSTSVTQSPTSSRASSEGGDKPPPLPLDFSQPPPPPPRSPSPVGLTDALNFKLNKLKSKSQSRDGSVSPVSLKQSVNDNSNSATSVLLTGVNEYTGGSKRSRSEQSESVEVSSHKSRSHKKQSLQRSESRSSSTRRDRKKRKRSHYRRKKHRSRSRSRSREHSKSHRSTHKKKQKHSSHRDKDKSSRKKKHRRQKSPSSDSSLPSSDSSTPSTPSSLPSESDIDEVQVIESDDTKASSRGSSVVSVPTTASSVTKGCKSNGVKETTIVQKLIEGTASTSEDTSHSPVSLPPIKAALSRIQADETASFSNQNLEIDKKTLFDPNTSSAMAKITQGLRAKLNALLEKGSKLE